IERERGSAAAVPARAGRARRLSAAQPEAGLVGAGGNGERGERALGEPPGHAGARPAAGPEDLPAAAGEEGAQRRLLVVAAPGPFGGRVVGQEDVVEVDQRA